jgi:hypothetical protein
LEHEIEAFGGIVCFQWLDPYFSFRAIRKRLSGGYETDQLASQSDSEKP